jgi:hypothetical protein
MKPQVWPQSIERWRRFVLQECKDIPVDLVLAIIFNESSGKAGEKAQRPTRQAADLPSIDGGTVHCDRALGLMQTVPTLVIWYNTIAQKNGASPAYYEDVIGVDERSARVQIRIGCWYFANCTRILHHYDSHLFPAQTPGECAAEQLQYVLLAYAMGPGKMGGEDGVIPRIERLRERNLNTDIETFKRFFAQWGLDQQSNKWINRPIHYLTKVWTLYGQHATIPIPGSPKGALPWVAGLGLSAAYLFFASGAHKKLWKEVMS